MLPRPVTKEVVSLATESAGTRATAPSLLCSSEYEGGGQQAWTGEVNHNTVMVSSREGTVVGDHLEPGIWGTLKIRSSGGLRSQSGDGWWKNPWDLVTE